MAPGDLLGQVRRVLRGRPRPLDIWWVAEPAGNDAASYGVSVLATETPPGQAYWRAVRVHHLTPGQNGGNHHIYFDVLDESGQRVYDARLHITWAGGEDRVTVEKTSSEPGANFPMWRGQVCTIEAEGFPSDRVVGLKTGHADEAPGNTWFHHSFLVVYQLAVATLPPRSESIISGYVLQGEGRTALLLRHPDLTEVARATVASDASFRFAALPAGTYVVSVEDAAVRSDPLMVDGENEARVSLVISAAAASVISGRVGNGAGRTVLLLQYPQMAEVMRATVADDASFQFMAGAGTCVVAVDGTDVRSDPFTVDGQNEVSVTLALAESAASTISGHVWHGAGRTVLLLQDPQMAEVMRATVADDASFQFMAGAGTYVVAMEGTDVRSAPFTVDGQNEGTATLTMPGPAKGTISGRVRFGTGRTALLLNYPEASEVARTAIASNASFRFTEVAEGTYVVGVEQSAARSEPIMVDGEHEFNVMLTMLQASSVIRGRVLHGAERIVGLFVQGELVYRDQVRSDERFSFAELAAGTYTAEVEGTGVRSAPIIVDGENEADIQLDASVGADRQKPLAHYVLFGSPTSPYEQADMLLAVDYLLAFHLAFGFRRAEAQLAARVTIIGDAVSQTDEEELRAAGSLVERIGGGAAAIERILAERVKRGFA